MTPAQPNTEDTKQDDRKPWRTPLVIGSEAMRARMNNGALNDGLASIS